MSKWTTFDPEKRISVTLTLEIDKLQECACEDVHHLNCLECGLCGKPVGKLRPLGIAWGKREFDTQRRGIRLCNTCFILAKKGD